MFTTLNTLANGNKTSPKFVDIKKIRYLTIPDFLFLQSERLFCNSYKIFCYAPE